MNEFVHINGYGVGYATIATVLGVALWGVWGAIILTTKRSAHPVAAFDRDVAVGGFFALGAASLVFGGAYLIAVVLP